MQWILQDYEDNWKLAEALDVTGIPHSFHKVVPIFGLMRPKPQIVDRDRVVIFGAYSLKKYARKNGLKPGVFELRPYVREDVWQSHLLNSRAGSVFLRIREIADRLVDDGELYFIRPVEDSKEVAGSVLDTAEIRAMAARVMALKPKELVKGSLDHDTEMMLTTPVRILAEWRVWIVREQVVTFSLYKSGSRVVYRPEIDEDALAFAKEMVALNPGYADAYVIDVCRTEDGLRILETNSVNAAGFYAGDLPKLIAAIENL